MRDLQRRAICLLTMAAVVLMPLLQAWAQDARGDIGKVDIAELDPKTEVAIDRALKYLGSTQNKDGSWGTSYPEAMTAVALMAFMVKGYFPGQEPYGDQMNKGVDYLIKQAKSGGGYIGNSMYSHGLATLALSEVWGMSDREELRGVLKSAVEIILRAQNREGGWRYKPDGQEADISVTVMQVVALASAKEAGILVPDKVIDKAIKYVKSCQRPGGGFAYMPGGGPGFARTGAGLLSLMMCGQRSSPAVKEGLGYLKGLPDSKFKQEEYFFYGHYYAMQSMYQAGENYYQAWYPKIRDSLLPKQLADGHWDEQNGPVFGTSIAVLVLGVPYRFLPIYQR